MTSITPYLLYSSCEDALEFLHRAFGFEEVLRYTGEEGYVNHAEMRLDGVPVLMGNPGAAYRNPRELGQETVGLYVEVDDADAVYERARAAGAEILQEPTDEEYGHRRFTARDPEGHHWFFAHVLEELEPEAWGADRAAT
jgi:PhnB protein